MLLNSISLTHFRSFPKSHFDFDGQTIAISGLNGSGKTNLLEAIYLLASAKSFRADVEEEMIQETQEVGHVKGKLYSHDHEKKEIEIVLTRGQVGGEKVSRKKFYVNGVSKQVTNFVGNLKAVIFGPWDLDLITGSPGLRRRYLDSVLIQTDREYHRALISYEKGLRQRNKLLEDIREKGASRHQLIFWNKLLIKNGNYLTNKREEFLSFLNLFKPFLNWQLSFLSRYDRSSISETRLQQYSQEEVAAGVTLVGPHRDNVEFFLERDDHNIDLSKFSSRGEQRLGVLWLKLSELEFLASSQESRPDRPVLLLDDIFSELDHRHRELVITTIGKQQTFITGADDHLFPNFNSKIQLIRL
ncbi:MAG: replication and repair protein RecF protein [Microgenomates group bacterium GW2011_GWA1_Microgenomates_45_10]|nr:MAG: replication and repair protein RecF protein [Microgenomates group bacterium GW2011_GWA2_44_7]KKT77347.1 MAG: replication and repair protein RecF protein [Microgenomates group bacterium GW2011_GWB1_44_8]KKT87112.1 MAG: replication and repair protein RecF protein [Microgenomates group bacterium GW2011_GWA1_Microgenomates_45_10]